MHSKSLADNGDLYSCGLNNRGQLGHSPTEEYVLKPTRVDGLDEAVVDVAAGHHHTIARTKSGALWAFGCNAKVRVAQRRRRKEGRKEGDKQTRVSIPLLSLFYCFCWANAIDYSCIVLASLELLNEPNQ